MAAVRRYVPAGFHVPLPPDEQRRAEHSLAVARVFAAVATLVAILLTPPASRPAAAISFVVLGGYIAFALSAVFLLHRTPERWRIPAVAVHVIDLSVAAAVTLCTSGSNSPFFVLFLFTLLAAAYRWGLVETVATAFAAIVLLGLEVLVPSALVPGAFEPGRLLVRSTYLLLGSVLIGYLAEREKQFRAEVIAIAGIVNQADVRAGIKRTLALMFEALLQLFDARRVVFVAYETPADRLFMWEAARSAEGSAQGVRTARLESKTMPTYMFEPGAAAWHAVRRGGPQGERFDIVALDSGGARLKTDTWVVPPAFLAAVGPFDRLMAIGDEVGEWAGRIFLLDPAVGADRFSALAFGRRVVRQIGPAIQNVYLMHRLRSAAAAIERARIARELHDGVIQAVMGVEIQVAALARRLVRESPTVVRELTRLDAILKQEIVGLRELMQQMKPLDLDPNRLVDVMAEFVQRFQRETGIAARFITQLDRVPLPPQACREVARILNEALINVRRHSGARNVFVRLATVNGDCRLSIDDDGRGFPFAGRMSQADLDASRKGPVVIKERVRLLGGQLTIESDPGRGARLEIAVPLSTDAVHG